MAEFPAAKFTKLIVVVGVLAVGVSVAQQPLPSKSSRFEVAIIKPSNPNHGPASSSSAGAPGGQFRLVNTPLIKWVELALSVSDTDLKAPSWLSTSNFDLTARLPVGQLVSPEMMKELMVERFGLKWHEELQSASGYQLVADKKVLAQPASVMERLKGVHGSGSGPSFIQGTNMPMSDLAQALARILGKPVVDATHLSGGYDIKLMWLPPDDAAIAQEKQYGKRFGLDVENLPFSVFTAVREQLGLRLESIGVQSKVIVVDHIDRQPTDE